MGYEFNPQKYRVYNIQTDRDEPQFKNWEDLPEKFRLKFKACPNGGYVRAKAVEEIQLAWHMAKSEDPVRKDYESKYNLKIKKIDQKANRQSDIVAESFAAG